MKVILSSGPSVLEIPGYGLIERGVAADVPETIALPHLHQGVLEPADYEATTALAEYRESLNAKTDNPSKE